jgi:hypothetical protein
MEKRQQLKSQNKKQDPKRMMQGTGKMETHVQM